MPTCRAAAAAAWAAAAAAAEPLGPPADATEAAWSWEKMRDSVTCVCACVWRAQVSGCQAHTSDTQRHWRVGSPSHAERAPRTAGGAGSRVAGVSLHPAIGAVVPPQTPQPTARARASRTRVPCPQPHLDVVVITPHPGLPVDVQLEQGEGR